MLTVYPSTSTGILLHLPMANVFPVIIIATAYKDSPVYQCAPYNHLMTKQSQACKVLALDCNYIIKNAKSAAIRNIQEHNIRTCALGSNTVYCLCALAQQAGKGAGPAHTVSLLPQGLHLQASLQT